MNHNTNKLNNKLNNKFNIQQNLKLDFFAQNKYVVADNVIASEYLQKLSDYVQKKYQESNFKKASIGRGVGEKVSELQRGDYILWLNPADDNETVVYFLKFLDELKLILNTEFFLSLKEVESHVTVYPAGAQYEKHVDQFKGQALLKNERKISFVLYLNKEWKKGDGGELVLYKPETPEQPLLQIEPLWGRLVYFMSDQFPHEVLTTGEHNRVSLTAWFLG